MTLAEQIRSLYGSRGDWNAGGVDRAAELADLLAAKGITDVSQLDMRDGLAYFGDKSVGFAGDYNNDGTYGSKAQDTLKDGNLIGWSARGDGNVGYKIGTDEQGNEYLMPEWGSSSDMGKVRDVAKLAALAAGAYYLPGLLGGESAIAGGSGISAGGTYGTIGGAGGIGSGIGSSIGLGSTAGAAGAGLTAGELAAAGITGGSGLKAGASALASAPGWLKTGLDLAGKAAPLIGAVAGAASSKDQQQTQTREPWGPAQDWIKSNIKDGQTLQDYYKKNPFNQTQMDAMNQQMGLINSGTAMLPGLLGQINSMGGYKRGGGSVPSPIQFNTQGLLTPAQINFKSPFGGG